MTDREIKRISKKLISKKLFKSLMIPAFLLLSAIFFVALPYLILHVAELFNLRAFAADVNGYLYPVTLTVIMAALTLWAVCVYSSFSLGEKAWFSGSFARRGSQSKRLFFWLKPSSSFKALKLKALLFFIKLFWAIAFLLPAALAFAAVYYLATTGGIEIYLLISLCVGGLLLALTGLIFYFIFTQRYFIAPHLAASNPKLGALQAVKQSKNLLEGYIFRIVRFKLSFLPWFLLSLLAFPVIFTYPYYKQSCSIIAKEICL